MFGASTALTLLLTLAFEIMLNRKPHTLAQTLAPEAWRHIADCATARHRAAADRADYERCNGESAASSMAFAQARLARDPFPIVAADGIRHYGATPTIDSLMIDRDHHISQGINGEPMAIPGYLESALYDESPGWRDKVAAYLQAIDDDNRDFAYHNFSLSGDISGEIDFVAFTPSACGDHFWSDSTFIAVDGTLRAMDGSLGDSGFLDCTIGWHVSDIGGDYLSDCEAETQRYATGYSSEPTCELQRDFIGEPVWHHGLQCFVGRLRYWPHPVRLYPETPCYGG
jgi:hypothetical protein